MKATLKNAGAFDTLLPHLTRASASRMYGYWLMAQGPADVSVDSFPYEPESSANVRLQVWQAAARAKQARGIGVIAGRDLFRRLDSSRDIGVILLTRLIGQNGKWRDTDNRESSYKSFRDGLAKAIGLKDDGPYSGIEWIVDERRQEPKISTRQVGETRISIWYSSSDTRNLFAEWCSQLSIPPPLK